MENTYTSEARIAGDTSMLIQNSDGDWYFFQYAWDGAVCSYVDKYQLSSLDRCWDGKFDRSVYIKGDFSASFKYCEDTSKNYRRTPSGNNADYNVITNNCTINVSKAIRLGVLNDGTKLSDWIDARGINFVPNFNFSNYVDLFHNNAFLLTDYNNQLKAYINSQKEIINQINNTEWYEIWKPYYDISPEYFQSNIDDANSLMC